MKRDGKPIRLAQTEFPAASEMLSRAFQADPIMAHFLPDPDRRPALAPKLFRCLLRFGALVGEVWTTSPRLEGLAVWVPPEAAHASALAVVRAGLLALPFTIGPRFFARFLSYCQYADRLRQTHLPPRHWYLQLLGVDPECHGQGHATALLEPVFARLDREHLPCGLDTLNGKNVAFYERFGFKVVSESTVPRTDVRLWVMVRGL